MRVKPRSQRVGMVILGVVDDEDLHLSGAPMPQKMLQKRLKGLRVEGIRAIRHEPTVARTHRAKDRHALARGGMEHHRINLFRGHPHHAARTVLLEVAFIFKPQLKVGTPCQVPQFFYMPGGLQGRPGR